MLKVIKAGNHGILLPELKIGLDYSGLNANYNFISHAHADHIPRNRTLSVYCTPPTARLMKLRGFNGKIYELAFGETLTTENAHITFYPAGHILGSALTFIESERGSLLYTGDCKTPPSPTSEGFMLPPRTVDQLIIEATFPLPIYKWKSYVDLSNEIKNFALKSINEGYTPIFIAYNLGKAQELMYFLKELKLPIQIHGAGYKLCEVYEHFGFDLGNYSSYDRKNCKGNILICPNSALEAGFASNLKQVNIAYCSGWASNESRQTQLLVDKLIPISDHLDFFQLIDLCTKLSPKKVWITHTPNPDVVQHYLNNLGIHSQYLALEGDGNG